MHWGVKEAGRGSDWLQPPLKLLTPTTTLPMGGKSAETPFLSCSGEQGTKGRGAGSGAWARRVLWLLEALSTSCACCCASQL